MSNPVVNRLGLNLFWYQFWYSDIRYSDYVQQDALIRLLIEIYLRYGANFSTTLFYNPYWYKTTKLYSIFNTLKYYRWASVTNKVFKTSTTYRFRISNDNAIFMRLSLLRFNSWLLINLFWFQPNKFHSYLQRNSMEHEYKHWVRANLSLQNYILKLRTLCYYTDGTKHNNPQRYYF